MLLVGRAANEYAKPPGRQTLRPNRHITTHREHYWKKGVNKAPMTVDELEAVGAVALDVFGNLAAATSSGGTTGKAKGSIGYAAIAGAGLYADRKVAVVW